MEALNRLIEHETLGQRARFERYAAELLYMIAAGKRIDESRAERFGKQLEKYFVNPFDKPRKEMTAAEIKDYIYAKVVELAHGLDDAGSKDHAG